MRFIHAADLHIDSPLRGLSAYDGAPVDRLRAATRQALQRLIDLAVAERVDFVLLCGDIFDSDWQDFRTGLFFRSCMAQLERAGIRVFIVQGNHDAQGVISRTLQLPANVTKFESRAAHTERVDELQVAIHGRSFPDRAVNEDFALTYPAPVPGYYNIGLLHTSLNGRPGHDPYAPTTVEILLSREMDYWALGHIHAREIVSESPWIVFPGNLQGRDAGETGAKGCMLVTHEGGRTDVQFVPLDTVRWNRLQIDVSHAQRVEDIGPLFHRALVPHLAGAADRLHALRVTLQGASVLHEMEARQPGVLGAHVQAAAQDVSEADVWIERVVLDLVAPIARSELAERQDALGELVRLVDGIGATDEVLFQWVREQLADAPEALPGERAQDRTLRLEDASDLRTLLADAEATVLARLAPAAEPPRRS
jgi:exonuclease SbcD